MKIICTSITKVTPLPGGDTIEIEVEEPKNYEDILNDLCIQYGTDRIKKFLDD